MPSFRVPNTGVSSLEVKYDIFRYGYEGTWHKHLKWYSQHNIADPYPSSMSQILGRRKKPSRWKCINTDTDTHTGSSLTKFVKAWQLTLKKTWAFLLISRHVNSSANMQIRKFRISRSLWLAIYIKKCLMWRIMKEKHWNQCHSCNGKIRNMNGYTKKTQSTICHSISNKS